MRKAAILAVVLVMALGGVAQAKASVAKVTGTYTYFVEPGNLRGVSVIAQATDPVKGTWSVTRPSGTYSGPVSCLRVVGADAWLAGPATVTDGLWEAVFLRVHDGGTPGTAGDTAFNWGVNQVDEGQTLADMEALCESMATTITLPDGSVLEFPQFPVESGNLTVRPAH